MPSGIIFHTSQFRQRMQGLRGMVDSEKISLLEMGATKLGELASEKAPVQVVPRPEHGGLLRASSETELSVSNTSAVMFAPVDDRNNYIYAEVQETHDEFRHIIGQSSYLGDSVDEYGQIWIGEVAAAMQKLM